MTEQPEHDIHDVKRRVGRLEESVSSLVSKHFSLEKDIGLMQRDISYIRTGQDKVSSGINRILWAIGLALVGAFTTFVINGGLV